MSNRPLLFGLALAYGAFAGHGCRDYRGPKSVGLQGEAGLAGDSVDPMAAARAGSAGAAPFEGGRGGKVAETPVVEPEPGRGADSGAVASTGDAGDDAGGRGPTGTGNRAAQNTRAVSAGSGGADPAGAGGMSVAGRNDGGSDSVVHGSGFAAGESTNYVSTGGSNASGNGGSDKGGTSGTSSTTVAGGTAGNAAGTLATGGWIVSDSALPPTPAPRPQSTVTSWNLEVSADFLALPFCYLTRPRLASDQAVICSAQTSSDVDCVGEAPPPGAPSLESLRAVVSDVILDTWQRSSRLELYHWQECPVEEASNLSLDSSMSGLIAVGFSNRDLADYMGRAPAGPAGLYLDWRKLLAGDYSGVVHTLGHVLGFGEEWRKPGYVLPVRCDAPPSDHSDLGLLFTGFIDYRAVMGGCYPLRAGAWLEAGDVLTAQLEYGPYATGSVIGHGGQCLTTSSLFEGGGRLNRAFPCRVYQNQLWYWDPDQRTLHTVTDGTAGCLAVYGGAVSAAGPTKSVATSCANVAAQRFSLENAMWRALGALCVARADDGLVAQRCTGLDDHWRFFDTDPNTDIEFRQIGLDGTSLCVATAPDPEAGDALLLEECDATDPSQHFEAPGEGVLMQNGLCISSPATTLDDGPVGLVLSDECGGSPAPFDARFYATGELRALGQCLAMDGLDPVRAQLSFVVVSPCDPASPLQQWDYHF